LFSRAREGWTGILLVSCRQYLSLVLFPAFALFLLNFIFLMETSGRPTMATIEARHSDKSESMNFLHLPREIRDKIYELVLVSRTGRVYMFPTLPHGSKTGRSVFFTDDDAVLVSPRVTLGLLRTCRQIYAEACEIFYEQNIFMAGEKLSLSALAKDMESYALPLIQRLEIIHCAAPNVLRVFPITRRLMKILTEMALEADFKQLTLIDSLLGHTHVMAKRSFDTEHANSPAMREIWAEVYQPPGTFKTRMKFVVSTEAAIGRHRYLEMLRVFDISEATIQDFLKDIHFSSGCDLFFEDHLLWRNFEKVKEFKLEMIEDDDASEATNRNHWIPNRGVRKDELVLI
jgi:hypothetical protein